MPIPRPFAKSQAMRLSQMFGYPVTHEALGELVLAIQSAMSENMAETVVSAILDDATSQSRCPMPGEVRRLIQERVSARVKMPKCEACGSSGWVMVWKLVTYRPGSYEIKACQTLNLNQEELHEFRGKLQENQDILSAAKPCTCLPADHKYLTGERQ